MEIEEKLESKINLKVWLKALKYLLPYWPQIILVLITIAFTSFYDSSFVPSMNAGLISCGNLIGYSDIFNAEIVVKILTIPISLTFKDFIIFYMIMIVLRSISIFITFFTVNKFEMYIMTSLRKDAFKKIQELSFSYFDKTPSGWLIARLQNDTSSIGDVLSWDFVRILWMLYDIFFTVITMFSTNLILSLVILATTPIIFLLTYLFERKILKYHRIARNSYSNFVKWLAECINGNKTIKTMAIEEEIYKECSDTTKDVREKRFKSGRISAPFYPLITLLNTITTSLIILIFPILGIKDPTTYSIATIILFLSFVSKIYNPIQQLSEIINELTATQASVEKVFGLLDEKPSLVDSKEVLEKYGDIFNNKFENFEDLKGDISFENVSFEYIKGTEIIHDLNLTIKKGTNIAIVGETGSGKSTTVNLLCRFYEPTKGSILIDNINYKDRSVGWLRSNIGYVQQNPFIFRGTVFDNIRYGNQSASDEEIINLCKKLGFDNFISNLKNGYNTNLEGNGDELSQGQKQLISFARALIRDPKILILDEATSSIDTLTESIIQSTLYKILKNRTSIIIAHRLSTIVDCDRIIVMKDGKIIEDGNHKSLMEQKGHYYNLYMNQFIELDVSTQLSLYKKQIEDKNIIL